MAQRDADGEVLTAKDANHTNGEIVFVGFVYFAWFVVQNPGGMDWESQVGCFDSITWHLILVVCAFEELLAALAW